MTDTEFRAWHARRRLWTRLLDTSEMLLLVATFAWGLQLVLVGPHVSREPVSQALLALWPYFPLWTHGASLMTLAAVHLAAMRVESAQARRACIFAQMLFFFYVEWSLVLARLFLPGVFLVPCYIAACILNYLSLVRPAKRREHDECKTPGG